MRRRDRSLASTRHRLAATAAGALVVGAIAMPAAQATICKYIDADGNTVYSNVPPARGLRKLSCEIADDTHKPGPGARPAATPSTFPRVEPETQKTRDEKRRKLLDDELASEQKLLEDAREAYGSGAPAPLPGEQSDAEKYRQRIARLRQAVQVHERNVEALRKEIASMR
jgi:hypothetical protein